MCVSLGENPNASSEDATYVLFLLRPSGGMQEISRERPKCISCWTELAVRVHRDRTHVDRHVAEGVRSSGVTDCDRLLNGVIFC